MHFPVFESVSSCNMSFLKGRRSNSTGTLNTDRRSILSSRAISAVENEFQADFIHFAEKHFFYLRLRLSRTFTSNVINLYINLYFVPKFKAQRRARSLVRVERGNGIRYFFFTSRLQKYCATTFVGGIVWKMFMWIFCAVVHCFGYRSKAIKGVSNTIVIGYSITII